MRTIWKGAISFGLINIPIRLSAATSKNNISFRLLHEKCKNPVNLQRYCQVCDMEVGPNSSLTVYEYE